MKDQLKLALAFTQAFERAQTANDKWSTLNRAELILKRKNKRAMRIRPENNTVKNLIISQNEPTYQSMRTTAVRLRNSLNDPKVVRLKFG